MNIPRIIAHRGSPRAAPENTLSSFRQAALEGAQWVEFDAALTIDDRVIVFHDDTVERTTDGVGRVAELPLDAIGALDAGSWFDEVYKNEPVPTLEETLETLTSLSLGFNMELKVDPGREVNLAATALPIVMDCWPESAPAPLISSFSLQAVATSKEIFPGWPRGMVFDQRPMDWAELGETMNLTSFNANHEYLTQEIVTEMRDAGYAVLGYTVNDPDRARELFSWGVDSIFTDVPGILLRALPT